MSHTKTIFRLLSVVDPISFHHPAEICNLIICNKKPSDNRKEMSHTKTVIRLFSVVVKFSFNQWTEICVRLAEKSSGKVEKQ